jgi:hypothetical protein
MEKAVLVARSRADKLFRMAQWLAIATIVYNILEGLVSVYFGFEDESLALFGFGIDSFIEVNVRDGDCSYDLSDKKATQRKSGQVRTDRPENYRDSILPVDCRPSGDKCLQCPD